MERKPTERHRVVRGHATEGVHSQAIQFLLNVINATICSSGEDYDGALEEFFPQLQALGQLIGATDLDDVSDFLRQHRPW